MLFKMAESVFFIFVVEPSDVKGTVSWPRRAINNNQLLLLWRYSQYVTFNRNKRLK